MHLPPATTDEWGLVFTALIFIEVIQGLVEILVYRLSLEGQEHKEIRVYIYIY